MAPRISWSECECALERGGPIIRVVRAAGVLASAWILGQAFFGPITIGIGHAAGAPMNNAMSNDACGSHNKALQTCLQNSGGEISDCQFYLDMLKQCLHGPGASTVAQSKN